MSSTGVRFTQGELINLFCCSATACERSESEPETGRGEIKVKRNKGGDFVELRGQPENKHTKKEKKHKKRHQRGENTEKNKLRCELRLHLMLLYSKSRGFTTKQPDALNAHSRVHHDGFLLTKLLQKHAHQR